MKKIVVLAFVALSFVACNKQAEQVQETEPEVTYATFGEEITPDSAITQAEMLEMFKNMKEGDTLPIKFKSTILDVCQKKGCWMSMDLEGDKDAFVRFTDYGFFVPLDAASQESIVEGRAFLSIVTVDELKHYAKDGGKTQEEIDAITEPKITYAIQADGVLIQNKAEQTSTETVN
jgi:hypothetical protein